MLGEKEKTKSQRVFSKEESLVFNGSITSVPQDMIYCLPRESVVIHSIGEQQQHGQVSSEATLQGGQMVFWETYFKIS